MTAKDIRMELTGLLIIVCQTDVHVFFTFASHLNHRSGVFSLHKIKETIIREAEGE